MIGIFCFFIGREVFGSVCDLVTGPKTVVVKDAEVTVRRMRTSKHSRSHVSFLVGETEDGKEVNIHIRGEDLEEKTNNICAHRDMVIVTYYKGIAMLYDINTVEC